MGCPFVLDLTQPQLLNGSNCDGHDGELVCPANFDVTRTFAVTLNFGVMSLESMHSEVGFAVSSDISLVSADGYGTVSFSYVATPIGVVDPH